MLIQLGERPMNQSQAPTPSIPTGPPAPHSGGIHPSRLENIHSRGPSGPPLQTNVPNAPSGPRGSARTPHAQIPSSPVNRGPPTGPAATERGTRNNGNPLRAINSVLTQSSPTDRMGERNVHGSNPPVRGRGANRANGLMDGSGEMMSPMLPPPHNMAPNSRVEGQYVRNNRSEGFPNQMDNMPVEDGRSEPRGHRDGRRSERSGRERSPDRSDRRPEDRNNRNGPPERPGHVEQERGSDRERGREKRANERDGNRREREREGERPSRDPERSGREPRESSRRERGSRDDGRASGRDERDRRNRAGGGGAAGVDDGRKRGREPMDQGQPHGDVKRRR